jgi:hypothetical protein
VVSAVSLVLLRTHFFQLQQETLDSQGRNVVKRIIKKSSGRELISYFHLIRRGPQGERRVQLFFYCLFIRYRGNVFTEPLPSNDRGIHIETETVRRDL